MVFLNITEATAQKSFKRNRNNWKQIIKNCRTVQRLLKKYYRNK
jgi:hypothetical protein